MFKTLAAAAIASLVLAFAPVSASAAHNTSSTTIT